MCIILYLQLAEVGTFGIGIGISVLPKVKFDTGYRNTECLCKIPKYRIPKVGFFEGIFKAF